MHHPRTLFCLVFPSSGFSFQVLLNKINLPKYLFHVEGFIMGKQSGLLSPAVALEADVYYHHWGCLRGC